MFGGRCGSWELGSGLKGRVLDGKKVLRRAFTAEVVAASPLLERGVFALRGTTYFRGGSPRRTV